MGLFLRELLLESPNSTGEAISSPSALPETMPPTSRFLPKSVPQGSQSDRDLVFQTAHWLTQINGYLSSHIAAPRSKV